MYFDKKIEYLNRLISRFKKDIYHARIDTMSDFYSGTTNSDWMDNLNLTEEELIETMLRATAHPEDLGIQRINQTPSDLMDYGVSIDVDGMVLTSMCFWLCVSASLGVSPQFLVSSLCIENSHPASDDEIKRFVEFYSVSLEVLSPDETRRYGRISPHSQHIRLWLEHGHYKRIL